MSTNITDFDPRTGRTTTRLVDEHCRGSWDFNHNLGQPGFCVEAAAADEPEA